MIDALLVILAVVVAFYGLVLLIGLLQVLVTGALYVLASPLILWVWWRDRREARR